MLGLKVLIFDTKIQEYDGILTQKLINYHFSSFSRICSFWTKKLALTTLCKKADVHYFAYIAKQLISIRLWPYILHIMES